MRFTFAFVAVTGVLSTASASIVFRQTGLPDCALNCLATANYGDCSSTDNVCLCKSEPFVTSTTQCIQSTCSGADLTAAEEYSQEVCRSVGVTLTPSATASGASASATSPSASTTAASTSTPTGSSSTGGALSTTANIFTGAAALTFVVFSIGL